jgi:SOS-response transcriptional repressor LexA
MPGVISIRGGRTGISVLLEAALPESPVRNIGVLLTDPETDRAFFRLRPSFDDIAEPDDVEVLAELEEHIRECAADMGGASLLDYLDRGSNAIRVTNRESIEVDSFHRVLERLYSEYVECIDVQPFRTHLPLYSLRVAAGDLGEDMQSLAEDWVPVPEGVRLGRDLFVGHVVGRSMEPRIPDGSLNLFRFHPQGSRQGKIVLVKRRGVLDETDRYTVKRYTSTKRQTGDDQWTHDQITLHPLNPEFRPWDVEADDFEVVAEWLRVIE